MSLSTTTNLAVLSTDTVAQNDLLLIDKGLGTEAQRTAGVVSTVSTVDVFDTFEDGSKVATYQLNGDETDLGGNYDGTATDVTYGTGKFGQAGVFNGTSSHIGLPNIGITSSSSFSFSAWINTSSDATIAEFWGTAAFGIGLSNLQLSMSSYTGSWNSVTATGTIPTNTPVFICAVRDSTTSTRLYINDTEYNLAGLPNSNNLGRSDGIGAHDASGSFNGYFDGLIDQVHIFNRVLTASEVSRLYVEEYKTVAISPALSAIPTTAETRSSYKSYTNDGYFNKPIDASSADFTETSTTTTAVYAIGDIIKDTSTNKLYKCTVINTVGILLTDNGYFTGLSTLSVTSGVFTYTDGKSNYGYNRKSDTFTGSVDFSGATDGIKYVAKDLNANTFNFLDGKPTIVNTAPTEAILEYQFARDTGLIYDLTGTPITTPISFMKNPIMCQNGTPQYVVKQPAGRLRRK